MAKEKVITISTVQDIEGRPTLYALTNRGNIYRRARSYEGLNDDLFFWSKVPAFNDRDETIDL
jgi:hypothetical protein